MIKAHKIRLHPTPGQANYFARAAGTARFTFNWARAEWQRQYEAGGKPSARALKKQFNAIRREQFPWTYETTKCAIEGAFMDVAVAFKNFFEGRQAGRKTGYPQFKNKKRSRQSFYLANDKFTVGDHWISVPKLGRFYPSSQLCHRCGTRRADLTLDERLYVCANPLCGYVGDRDENASYNILQEALRLVGP